MKEQFAKLLFTLFLFYCCHNESSYRFKNQIDSQKKEISNLTNNRIDSFSDYSFVNDTLQIKIRFNKLDSLNKAFTIDFTNHSKSVKLGGVAELIREEDDGKFYVPEGTPIPDQNNNTSYSCDSTYSYTSDKINLGFGFEKNNGNRLSFTIDHSFLKDIPDNDYTLYKIKK